MAISSTIHKVSLNIANMDTHYYQTHELTLALHPSETQERMMMRLIAFMLNANDRLSFTKGLSTDEEPDLWQKSLSDEIELWIELGQVDEKRIRQACGKAKEVIIYTYHSHKTQPWWNQNKDKLKRFKNLNVWHINADSLEVIVSRSMQLQCNIQDGEIYLSSDETNLTITLNSYEF